MASVIETVILGIIQGLTEWLPVSSSGHLSVAKELLGLQPPVVFYVLLHLGTLIVVVVYFRRDVLEILEALARRDLKSDDGRLGLFIVLGSIPTAVIGYAFRDFFKSFFDNLVVVGVGLLATGFLLFLSERRKGERALNWLDSLLIGIAQGIAIIPGVSRSGATISTGLLRRINREIAFKFSFLLSIPAVLGATVEESGDLGLLIGEEALVAVVLGVAVSMIVGYMSLRLLQKVVLKQRFHWFAFYCWAAGAIIIIWMIL
jgi:undecaprenyl-diphosphatase